MNRRNAEVILKSVIAGLCGLFLAAAPRAASGQTCGSEYEIKQGDTLAQIASRTYGNASQWTIIFYANQDRLGTNASLLVPGLSIRIPCVNSSSRQERLPEIATTLAQPPVPRQGQFVLSTFVKRIEFLTADGFSPFADRSQPSGGMLTHVISAAMDKIKSQSNGQFDYGVSWVNDWSAHLNPLLATRAFDGGFPWTRPACENFAQLDQDGKYRCQRFFFSEPLYEALTLAFVKKDSSIQSATDEDLRGKTVCRPAGQSTYELDEGGKNWIKGNLFVLIRPQTVGECFRLLDTGSADAVIVTDLVGRAAIANLAMTDRVRIIERPVAIGTLHVLISKTHPQARTILYYINEALAKLREEGEYDRIVEKHLAVFWDADTGDKDKGAVAVSSPAPAPPAAKSPAEGEREASPPKGPSAVANGQAKTPAAAGEPRK